MQRTKDEGVCFTFACLVFRPQPGHKKGQVEKFAGARSGKRWARGRDVWPKMGTAFLRWRARNGRRKQAGRTVRPWHRVRSTKFAKHVPEMDMLTNQASHAAPAPVNCPPDAPSHSQPSSLIRALCSPSLTRRRRPSAPPTRNQLLLSPRLFGWPRHRLRRRPLRLRWPTYRLRTRPRARCTPCRL